MAAEAAKAIKIFYCYAHEDRVWRDELEKHLSALKRLGHITEWHDRQIQPGANWEHEIDVHLDSADIVLLLVSADFIHSDYCWSVEMRKALEKHREGDIHVIPIILRPVTWERTPISELQVLPTGGVPITRWANRDEAFKDVTQRIGEVVMMLVTQTHERNSDLTLTPTILLTQQVNVEPPISPQVISPLHFIWILDCSGSMGGNKLIALNEAISRSVLEMQQIAQSNLHARVLFRAIKFSSGASWHIAKPTPIEKLQWRNLGADGVSDMGKALLMVAEQLKIPPMEQYGLPPVLVLVNQGYPTDHVTLGLDAIMAQSWGRNAIRIAIGIGGEADYTLLEKFADGPERKVLQGSNSEELVQCIRWAATVPLKAVLALKPQDSRFSTNLSLTLPPSLAKGSSSKNGIW